MPCKVIYWISGSGDEDQLFLVFLNNRSVSLCILNGRSWYCLAALVLDRGDWETFYSLVIGAYYGNLRRTIRREGPRRWALEDSFYHERQDPQISIDIGIKKSYNNIKKLIVLTLPNLFFKMIFAGMNHLISIDVPQIVLIMQYAPILKDLFTTGCNPAVCACTNAPPGYVLPCSSSENAYATTTTTTTASNQY